MKLENDRVIIEISSCPENMNDETDKSYKYISVFDKYEDNCCVVEMQFMKTDGVWCICKISTDVIGSLEWVDLARVIAEICINSGHDADHMVAAWDYLRERYARQ